MDHVRRREEPSGNSTTDSCRLDDVVFTSEEFDQVVSQALPLLLDRATSNIKRFLRETGQWCGDVADEKFVLRWASEYVERFLICGRTEVPCRPLFLLDSLVASQHSKPEPFCYHPQILTPLGRFLDGLTARACISRDALIALYHHCYGLGASEVIAAAALNETESQRIYKNLQRWRESGWRKAMEDLGITKIDLHGISEQLERSPERTNSEARNILRIIQTHYRKTEPDHYHCRSTREWDEMLSEGYGVEYRIWHLALCQNCIQTTWHFRNPSVKKFQMELHVWP